MLQVPDIVPIDIVGFFVGLSQSEKKFKPENTSVQKYTFNKKRSEESSKNVCIADLENSLGKEKLYLRKIKKK